MPNTHLLWLVNGELASSARPGQFVMVLCDQFLLRRPFSIHCAVPPKFALLYKVVGKGTRWLSSCCQGKNLALIGPLGNGYTLPSHCRRLLLVAGGMGIAPLAFLADKSVKEGREVKLVIGASTASQLCSVGLQPPLEILPVTEDGSAGEKGLASDLVPRYASWADQICACGPAFMYLAISRLALEKPAQVSLEARMGCGLGACCACTIATTAGPKRVCRDGPVFELGEIMPQELMEV